MVGAIVNPTRSTIMLFLTVIPLIIQDVVAARQMTSSEVHTTLSSLDAFKNIAASAIPPKP